MKKIFYNKKNQKIGEYNNGIFRKIIKGSKHIMHIFNAIGFEETLVQELKLLKCKELRIKDSEDNTIYTARFKLLENKGWVADHSTPQRFLKITDFKTT